jgi:hypothetical protein
MPSVGPSVRRSVLLLCVCCVGAFVPAEAQRRPGGGGGGRNPTNVAGATEFEINNVPYDGRFAFVRLRYTPARTGFGGGGGYFGGINYQWDHDYDRGDRHFRTILSELTAIGVSQGTNILSIGSPDLFKYPLAYMAEPGWWTQTDAEASNLRTYLAKGGFLIFDDFAGNSALANFETQLLRVLPGSRLVQLDIRHPIFHSFFEIPNLDFTHPLYGVPSAFLGVYQDNDPSKRLLLIANYNNDISEPWEWSDTGLFPVDVSNEAFKLGINYVVYSMTH